MTHRAEYSLKVVVGYLANPGSRIGLVRGLCLLAVLVLLIGLVEPAGLAGADQAAFPDWLEPRGLHIVELVGQVPETLLKDTIVSYGDAVGLVVYQSGIRDGNRLVVTTTIYPRVRAVAWAPNGILTEFGCLGQNPFYDHMGSVAPASTLRIYDSSGKEVTQLIQFLYLTDMGTRQPSADSSGYVRYPVVNYGAWQTYPLPIAGDGLHIPANGGCRIEIPGQNLYPLTGVFTLDLPPATHAQVVGIQDAKVQSYIGGGELGIFQPLMDQMRSRYPNRHTRIAMEVPAGADFLLLKFPPMPGDAYKDPIGGPYLNADRPIGGTYRLSTDPLTLGTDLTFSAGFPLAMAWRDADQARGSVFLPTIPSPLNLAAPEYVIPAGIAYNRCFVQGGCSDSLLQQIYEKEMDLKLVYLSVTTLAQEGQWVPVQLAGPAWAASVVAPVEPSLPQQEITTAPLDLAAALPATNDPPPDQPWQLFLPIALRSEILPPVPPPPAGRPCGWFDSSGRMLDFAPGY